MKTMKWFGRQIELGKYGLAVVDYDGFIVSALLTNVTINEVVETEEWFNYKKLGTDKQLKRFIRTINGVYTQNVDEEFGLGSWLPAGF